MAPSLAVAHLSCIPLVRLRHGQLEPRARQRVYLEVGKQCGVKIHVDRPRARLLECMQLPAEDAAVLTSELTATRWRVVPMGHLRAPKLRELMVASGGRYTGCVAFRPTGWSFGRAGASAGPAGRTVRLSGGLTLIEVPYSEHSSYAELQACVRALRPRKIVATVGGGPLGDRHAGVPRLLA